MSDQNNITEIHVRGIPSALWRKVKVVAAQKGVTIRQAVVDALSMWAKERDHDN